MLPDEKPADVIAEAPVEEPEAAGPSPVADWALDQTLAAIQAGATDKQALQEATGLGPSDLRRALEVLEEDGVVRPTEDGWEADPSARPTEREEAPEGVVGPRAWEPPAATGPVTVGVPWESREGEEEGAPEAVHDPLGLREAPGEEESPVEPGVSSDGLGVPYEAAFTLKVAFPTPDDPVDVARLIGVRLEELVAEVFQLDSSVVLETIVRTEQVYSR